MTPDVRRPAAHMHPDHAPDGVYHIELERARSIHRAEKVGDSWYFSDGAGYFDRIIRGDIKPIYYFPNAAMTVTSDRPSKYLMDDFEVVAVIDAVDLLKGCLDNLMSGNIYNWLGPRVSEIKKVIKSLEEDLECHGF